MVFIFQFYPFEDILSRDYILDQWNPSAIRYILGYLKPDNMKYQIFISLYIAVLLLLLYNLLIVSRVIALQLWVHLTQLEKLLTIKNFITEQTTKLWEFLMTWLRLAHFLIGFFMRKIAKYQNKNLIKEMEKSRA